MSRSLDHLLDGAVATLREAVLPRLSDANARADLFSVLQVLERLAHQVDWADGPLQAELAVRRAAFAAMPAGVAALCGQLDDAAGTPLQAIDALDARVAGLVERVSAAADLHPALRAETERWVLAYGLAANAKELEGIPSSQLGQLTAQ